MPFFLFKNLYHSGIAFFSKKLRLIGIGSTLLSLLINPWTVQAVFVADGNIADVQKITSIIIFEIALCCLGIYAWIKSTQRWNEKTLKRIGKVFLCVVVYWIGLEIASYMAIAIFFRHNYERFPILNRSQFVTNDLYADAEPDRNFGYVLKKDTSTHAVKSYKDGTPIYDVVYTTDQYRRRTVQQAYLPTNKHLILFGCSFAFGEGLNDQETLQYQLQQHLSGYNIYNYAVHGYGPQQMLALLESAKLPQEVESKVGDAVYVLVLPTGIQRLMGSLETDWVYDFPYYFLDKNQQVVRKGNFLSERTLQTYIYQTANTIRKKSPFLQLLNVSLPISHDDILLMYKTITKSQLLYEQQFHGRFIVLIHPFSVQTKESMELIQLLEANNIEVIQYKMHDALSTYKISGDGHANKKMNQELASYMASVVFGSVKRD